MAEDELPIVITAIADAQSEGFVASGLFAQGLSVVYRALDTTSLRKYLASNFVMRQRNRNSGRTALGIIGRIHFIYYFSHLNAFFTRR